jgi:hypothetical protein
MFSRKMMFKRAVQMEIAWSKVGAIWRMLEDFPLLLLHDNAHPHTANKTNQTLRNFKWEVLEHPPYRPDLAPSDIHLFGHLKYHLSAEHFPDDEVVERKSPPGSDSRTKTFMLLVFRGL